MTVYWHCENFSELLLREWEEEFFIFNPASGDTHLMNALSMEILRLLGQAPFSLDMLVDSLHELVETDDREQLLENLGLHLRQLDAMGLITPSSSETATTDRA